jgi:hypothetical protein
MEYKPLTMKPARIERLRKITEYEGKAKHCLQMADVALGPLEREGWMELAKDWEELATEARQFDAEMQQIKAADPTRAQ